MKHFKFLHTCCAFAESCKSVVGWSRSSLSDGTWMDRKAARLRTTTLNLKHCIHKQLGYEHLWICFYTFFTLYGLQVFWFTNNVQASSPIRDRRPFSKAYSSEEAGVQSFFSQLKQPSLKPHQAQDHTWYFSQACLWLQLLRWKIQGFVPPQKQLGFISRTARDKWNMFISLQLTEDKRYMLRKSEWKGQTWERPDWSKC